MRKITLYSSSFFAHLAVLGLLLPVLALAWRSEGTAESATFQAPLALNHLAISLGLTLWACGAGLRRLRHRAEIPVVFLGASALGSLSVLGLDWGSGLAILGAIQVGILAVANSTPLRVAGMLITGLFALTYGQCYAALGYSPIELTLTSATIIIIGGIIGILSSRRAHTAASSTQA